MISATELNTLLAVVMVK